MAATLGRKQLSYKDRKEIYRTTPNVIGSYNHGVESKYKDLINSLSRAEYIEYEALLHTYGTQGRKRQVMLDVFIKKGITGSLLALAKIRVDDLYLHQKLVAMLRHRWTSIAKIRKDKTNANPDQLWMNIARAIQSRCLSHGHELWHEWVGADGRIQLVNYLKTLYDTQNGLCAISREELKLQSGNKKTNPNKCSPDRKNSNKGYVPGNIWLVTWWVNSMKMDVPLITFWKRIDQLANVRELNKQGKRYKTYTLPLNTILKDKQNVID